MSIRTDLNFQRVICNDEPEEDDRRDRYQGLEGGGVEILLQGTEKGRGKGQTERAAGQGERASVAFHRGEMRQEPIDTWRDELGIALRGSDDLHCS